MASGILSKMTNIDFIVSLMFMNNILFKKKIVTHYPQGEKRNVLNATIVIEATLEYLEQIRNDNDSMNAQLKHPSFSQATMVEIRSAILTATTDFVGQLEELMTN